MVSCYISGFKVQSQQPDMDSQSIADIRKLFVLSVVYFWGRKCVKNTAALVALPHVFHLSVHYTFTREIQMLIQKFTPLIRVL